MKKHAAFTLAELLVGMGILVVLFGFLLVSANQTTKLIGSTAGKVEQFREARNAFERVSTRISQATLNTYWDYDSPTAPTRYERRSELRFISGGVKELGIAEGGTGKRLVFSRFSSPRYWSPFVTPSGALKNTACPSRLPVPPSAMPKSFTPPLMNRSSLRRS